MVKKGENKYGKVVDLRKVNAVVEEDAYPLAIMELILNKLKTAKYISQIDLCMAYHQIKSFKRSRQITAFFPFGMGLWQFKRMLMGYSGSGTIFQRLMDKILEELEPYCYCYLDDIVIATDTFEQHLELLEKMITRLRESKLTINREKSHFCKSSVKN